MSTASENLRNELLAEYERKRRTVPQLRDDCQRRGLSTAGRKADLIERLVAQQIQELVVHGPRTYRFRIKVDILPKSPIKKISRTNANDLWYS